MDQESGAPHPSAILPAPHGASTVGVPEKLLDRVDELEDELKEYQDHNERDKAEIRQQVTAAVEESERSGSGDTSERTELSPMGHLLKLGENSVTAEVPA